jgi:hypothetical protein
MKDANDLTVDVLANPSQAADLITILRLTVPGRRLSAASVHLGVTLADVFTAAGMTPHDRNYYTYRRGGARKDLPSMIMVRLARVIGVPFDVLWDDEALESPADVIRVFDHMGYGSKKNDAEDDSTRESRRRGALRLAAG